jgi:GNAT superfamily N-acetyltransferase
VSLNCCLSSSRFPYQVNTGPLDLAALGTAPKYQRQGAGAKLLEWGLERADDRGLTVYVEGTPAAVPLYERSGFREIERLKLELAPWVSDEHSNVCMIREPQA